MAHDGSAAGFALPVAGKLFTLRLAT